MRHYILFVLLLFTTAFSKAQSQEKNVYNNTNTNSGNTLIKQDTTSQAPELEEMHIESKKTKSFRTVKSPQFEQDEKADKDSNLNMQQLKGAKYQFETNYSSSRHQVYRRSASTQELLNMKQSAQLYANMLPGSFEKHFYSYLLNKYDPKHFPELKQAAKLEPNKTEVQQELAAYGIAVNDQELADSVAVQMIAQNKITGGLLTYATDLVNSVPNSGTLLLHGYTELIPVNYERNTLGRADLELISVDLMQSPAYQASLESKGYVMPNSTFVDTTFVQTFCALNVSKNIYLSMSFPKEYFQGITSSLNTVGLTFAYDQTMLDYNTWNSTLIETKWKKQELGISKDQQSDALSANYLPALISVARIYEEYNKTEEVKEINQLIMSVATRARKTGQLSKIKR
ncbi:MAG: hypothetical protein K0S23_202 [Fluviicola sp.]|jgi:hypothetical protein|uniref:hypothetical protein n=1 Tax=Fluviicola sp. TaxID=1917219 RepID=UPI0026163F92|nr:hypothetical protein [Fluviicola sp.]MDF3025895.1 hypothetical protein [Fluviicola sp.]